MTAQNAAAACTFFCCSLASNSYVFWRFLSLCNCDSDEHVSIIKFSETSGGRQGVIVEGTVTHFQEFAVLYHFVSHPCTYIPCVMLGEGEWQEDVKEGCLEAYKYSAVEIVGL